MYKEFKLTFKFYQKNNFSIFFSFLIKQIEWNIPPNRSAPSKYMALLSFFIDDIRIPNNFQYMARSFNDLPRF